MKRRTAFVTMTALIDDVPDGMDEEAICQLVRDNVSMFSKNAFWSTEVIDSEATVPYVNPANGNANGGGVRISTDEVD